MTKAHETHAGVDLFLQKAAKWRAEFALLRQFALDCGLAEGLKWGQPCYTLDGRNVVLIHGFKDYCALLFFKGALIKDEAGVLVQQTENVQAARQMRFTSVTDIRKAANVITSCINEAIAIEKSGRKVPMKETAAFVMPSELQERFGREPKLEQAFAALTPGRQHAYLLHFSGAKQAKTRLARIDKAAPLILAGRGLDD